jgi:hypothetical protein
VSAADVCEYEEIFKILSRWGGLSCRAPRVTMLQGYARLKLICRGARKFAESTSTSPRVFLEGFANISYLYQSSPVCNNRND